MQDGKSSRNYFNMSAQDLIQWGFMGDMSSPFQFNNTHIFRNKEEFGFSLQGNVTNFSKKEYAVVLHNY